MRASEDDSEALFFVWVGKEVIIIPGSSGDTGMTGISRFSNTYVLIFVNAMHFLVD